MIKGVSNVACAIMITAFTVCAAAAAEKGTSSSGSTANTAETPSSPTSVSPGPLSAYCDQICNYLQRSWKAVPGSSNDVNLKVSVGAANGINKVELDTTYQEKESASIQQQVLAQMKTLKFPGHPPKDLLLSIVISPQVEDFSVCVADIDYTPWIRSVQARIKQAWYPPKRIEFKRAVALFEVSRGGKLLSCELKPPSHDPEVDRAALSAVKNAAPFPGSPDGMPPKMTIQFAFDYHAAQN